MEEAEKMKRQIHKQFVQVFVAHCEFLSYLPKHFTLTFVELCMEMPFWKSSKTSGVHFFYMSSFTRELAYVRIKTYSNT